MTIRLLRFSIRNRSFGHESFDLIGSDCFGFFRPERFIFGCGPAILAKSLVELARKLNNTKRSTKELARATAFLTLYAVVAFHGGPQADCGVSFLSLGTAKFISGR